MTSLISKKLDKRIGRNVNKLFPTKLAVQDKLISKMAFPKWKNRKNIWTTENIITWGKEGLKYPKSEDISVIKTSDGWVVNRAGYRGGENYYSKSFFITTKKHLALKKAREYMRRH